MRLLDPAHFLAARSFRLERKLMHQPPQRALQPFRQLLVVLTVRICLRRGQGRCLALRSGRDGLFVKGRPFHRNNRRVGW